MEPLRSPPYSVSILCMDKRNTRISSLLALCVAALAACSQNEVAEKPSTKRILSKAESAAFLIGIPKKSLAQAANAYASGKAITADDYIEAAEKALKEPDYVSAETLLTEAIKLDPNHAHAYKLRGRSRCNAIIGKDALAIEDLKRAIELGERHPSTYEYLARLYHDNKQRPETIAALQESLKIKPNQREAWQFLAAVYIEQDDYEKALECDDMAVKIDPKDAQPYFIRAQLLHKMKRYDEALRDYETVTKIEPVNEKVPRKTAAYRLQSEILSQAGRHEEAIKTLDDAINADPTDDDLLRLRGLEYGSLKMYDKAIADYTEAIDMSPEFAGKAYEARSKAYAHLGKTELAQKDLAEAKRLDDKPAEKPIFELR